MWAGERPYRYWRRYVRSHNPTAKDLDIAFATVLRKAQQQWPAIEMTPGILGGTPRIAGTRVPVSMVLDAVEFYGQLEGALKSYPDLSIEQVKQAVSFAASVLECRVVEEPANSVG